jgi:hypothetical protein
LINLGVESQLAEARKEKEQVDQEKETLAILLEEERKKVEDLQFRFYNFFSSLRAIYEVISKTSYNHQISYKPKEFQQNIFSNFFLYSQTKFK